MKALPRRERDFYASFSEAQSQEERAQILSLIPENERRVYMAQWLRQEEGVARAKQAAKISQNFDDRVLAAGMAMRKSEGYPASPELEEQWMEETGGQMPYDEWIRHKKAEEYFSTHSLPGADWIGWHPSADLEDVKLKYVEMAGCISPNSCLFNNDFDEIRAGGIEIGMPIMNSRNESAIVKQIFKNPNNKPVYELKNSGLHLGNIVITGNHIVPVVRQSGDRYIIKEVPVEHIRPRDKMMYPKISFDESILDIDLLDFAGENKSGRYVKRDEGNRSFYYSKIGTRYIRDIFLDKNFGKFLGWFAAEGSLHYKNGNPSHVEFALNITEYAYAEWIVNYARMAFGVSGSIRPERDNNGLRVIICGGPIVRLIKYFIRGKKATEKYLTQNFFKLPVKTIMHAMLGWFHGDGWIGGDRGRLYIQTSSRLLSKQGWFILNSLGIRTRLQFISEEHQASDLCPSADPAYRLGIGDEVARTSFIFARVAKQSDYYKTVKISNELEQYFWFGVQKAETEYGGECVYDFNVAEPHFYTTICGIVHNSDHHDFDLWGARRRALARKPYIDEDMVRQLQDSNDFGELVKTRLNAKNIAKIHGDPDARVNVTRVGANMREGYDIEIVDKREGLVRETFKYMGTS
jgi:hypothetical protein